MLFPLGCVSLEALLKSVSNKSTKPADQDFWFLVRSKNGGTYINRPTD